MSGDEFTVDEVVNIFNRVNKAGTPLTKADLALAHVCSIWPEARAEMRTFQAEMAGHGFGVDFNFLVRCLSGVATGSVMLEGSFVKAPAATLQAAWKEMKAAFEHLVNVLRHEAFIDDLGEARLCFRRGKQEQGEAPGKPSSFTPRSPASCRAMSIQGVSRPSCGSQALPTKAATLPATPLTTPRCDQIRDAVIRVHLLAGRHQVVKRGQRVRLAAAELGHERHDRRRVRCLAGEPPENHPGVLSQRSREARAGEELFRVAVVLRSGTRRPPAPGGSQTRRG